MSHAIIVLMFSKSFTVFIVFGMTLPSLYKVIKKKNLKAHYGTKVVLKFHVTKPSLKKFFI